MKPKTFTLIKNQLADNLRNMNICDDTETYHEMSIENETMEWICKSEGKLDEFKKFEQQVYLSIEIEEDES